MTNNRLVNVIYCNCPALLPLSLAVQQRDCDVLRAVLINVYSLMADRME